MYTAAEVAPLSTMASAMFFGTIMFTTVALSVRCYVFGHALSHVDSTIATRAFDAANNPRSSKLDTSSFASIYTLLYHCTVLGVIMFYAYICEYHPPYPHAVKTYDRDQFFFLTALLIFISFFTMKSANKPKKLPVTAETDMNGKSNGVVSAIDYHAHKAVAPVDDNTEILNRDQTEEWKGWMQFMFLLYHYYRAEEVYNSIRIMITCYVWMTGFGNFSFFYIKADYSLIRVLQMLWRLNFLVLFLCLTQGTTYILYYICLLHTYFFMMVYFSMRIGKDLNYTKWGIRIKLVVIAFIIFLVWDVDTGIFQFVHKPFLGNVPVLGATSGGMWEWYFRSSLDHWSTFLGMVFALNFPITSLFFRKLEALPIIPHVLAKASMGVALFAAFYWWVTVPFMQDKFDYNQTNSYYGWIPLMTYIYFRNITPWLRSHTLDLLHQIGKTTLETYLMQHHIWLTSNAKSLLTLIPGWPKMNFLIVSIFYVVASRRLYQLTLYLRAMILPDDKQVCIRNLIGMFTVLGAYVGLAHFLKYLGILSLCTVGIVSLIFGIILYNVVIQKTWENYAFVGGSTNANDAKKSSPAPHTFDYGPTVGAFIVLLVGLGWNYSAMVGAGKIQLLPATCSDYVHKGSWAPIDMCNEDTRGFSHRDSDLSTLACSMSDPTYVWGWKTNPSSSHCRFTYKEKGTLLKELKHRNITFVGDSVVRHLYHSFCRNLGTADAGAYNTTVEKHMDYSRKYGSTFMEFRWAPYVSNLTVYADMLLHESSKPDIVILGGGAWDRLHSYNDDQERNTLHGNVDVLVSKLRELKTNIPVTWVVPTLMNTWALPSEEKRVNINEDEIDKLRALYESKGIHSSASFVLDGRAFTASRESESYDGVHYPLAVYNAGTQILANAFDWLLQPVSIKDEFVAPKPGIMDNGYLGLLMLLLVVIGVFGFDGFMGFSYFAAIFVPDLAPKKLYHEAFSSLHSRLGLPPLAPEHHHRSSSDFGGDKSKSSEADPAVIEEIEPFFLQNTKNMKE